MITSDWDNVMPMAWTREALHCQHPCKEMSGKDSVSVAQVLFPKPEKAGDATLLQPRGA